MTRPPTIVSIQSQLVFGCAGNNAAVPLLERLGATVHAVPTAILSNTPHYPTIAGGPMPAELIRDLLNILLDRVPPNHIDVILTGYIASAETAAITARFIQRVRASHPGVVVLCDPVMGDTDYGLYVSEDVAEAIRTLLTEQADILTPNLFEAKWLAETSTDDPLELLEHLLLRGRTSIGVVTGVLEADGRISTIAGNRQARWVVTTDRLDLRPTGTGDIFSAAFARHFYFSRDIRGALEAGVAAVYDLLQFCRTESALELQPQMLAFNHPVSPGMPI